MANFENIPDVKLGIIAVSRDCFVISLSEKRRAAIVKAFGKNTFVKIPATDVGLRATAALSKEGRVASRGRGGKKNPQ